MDAVLECVSELEVAVLEVGLVALEPVAYFDLAVGLADWAASLLVPRLSCFAKNQLSAFWYYHSEAAQRDYPIPC